MSGTAVVVVSILCSAIVLIAVTVDTEFGSAGVVADIATIFC